MSYFSLSKDPGHFSFLATIPIPSPEPLTPTEDEDTAPSPVDGSSGDPSSVVAHDQSALKRDPVFCIENPVYVAFEAEKCLFRVPTYLFTKESEYFTRLFQLPTQDNPQDASQRVLLPADIRSQDFHDLLEALYPISFGGNFTLSQSQWVSVLKLSTKWHFDGVRRRAISGLESLNSLPALRKIILGRQCFIPSWYITGLQEMVGRNERISHDEALTMDTHRLTAFKLSMLREKRFRGQGYAPEDVEVDFEDEIGDIYTAAEEEGIKLIRPLRPHAQLEIEVPRPVRKSYRGNWVIASGTGRNLK